VGPGVVGSPEEEFCVFVPDAVLAGALVEGAVAVLHEHLGPAREFALLGVSGEVAAESGLVFEVLAAAVVGLAALVAALDDLCDCGLPAGASAVEEDDEFVGVVALVDVEGGG